MRLFWGILFLFATVFGHAMDLPKKAKDRSKSNMSKKFAYSKLYAHYCSAKILTYYGSFFEYAILEDKWAEADYILAKEKNEEKKYDLIYPAILTLIEKQLHVKLNQLMLRTTALCPTSYNGSYAKLLSDLVVTNNLKLVEAVISCIPEEILKKDKEVVAKLGAGLIYACEKDIIDLAKLLLQYHAQPNRRINESGHWPLGLAVRNRNSLMIELLLHYNAGINIKNGQLNTTPLSIAIHNMFKQKDISKDILIIKQLLQAGADPNQQGYYAHKKAHLTSLVPAMEFSRYDLPLLKLLLSYGAYVRAYPVFEDIVRQPDLFYLFINAGIGPNIKDDKQVTFFCNTVKNITNNVFYFKVDTQQAQKENVSNLIKKMLLFGASLKAVDSAKRCAGEYLHDIEFQWKCGLSLSALKTDHFFRFTRSFYKKWKKRVKEIRKSAIKTKKLPINWDEECDKEKRDYELSYDIAYFIKNYYDPLPTNHYVEVFKNSIDNKHVDSTPIITVRAPALQTLLNN